MSKKAVMGMMIFVLVTPPGVLLAQNFGATIPPPSYHGLFPLSTEMKLKAMRTGLNWKGDQYTSNKSTIAAEFGIAADLSRLLKLKYSVLVNPTSQSELFAPQTALNIGSSNFGRDPTSSQGQQGQAQEKQVTLDWSFPAMHRLSLSGPLLQNTIRPVAVCEWSGLTMTATGEIDGKPRTETETLQKTFVGLGANADYTTGRVGSHLMVVGSDRYLFAEAGAVYRFNAQTLLSGGWQWKTLEFPNDTTVRVNGVTLGLRIDF